MTFDGFDAAPLIEGGNFMPGLRASELASATLDVTPPIGGCGCSRGPGAAAEPALMTLDAALREAARAERAAIRADALLLDLWVRPGGGFEILDLPARGATSAQAWAILSGDNDQVAPDGGKDFGLRAAYGDKPPEPKPDPKEEDEILVKGTRTNTMNDGSAWVDFWGGGYEGDQVASGPSNEPSETEQNDCRDRHALEAKSAIKDDGNSSYKEHASVIYRDANGQVRHSPPIEGGWGEIPIGEIVAWMNANGVSMSQMIGLAHNHDQYNYGNAPEINRYPSGGDVEGGDWDAADWFVNQGAGGPGGENFALYIIDTSWRMREFEYRDRDTYKDLNADQRERGVSLPDEVQSDGSSCG